MGRRKLLAFPALSDSNKATVASKRKTTQRKELKDMTIQNKEWWGVIKAVMDRVTAGVDVGITATKQGIGVWSCLWRYRMPGTAEPVSRRSRKGSITPSRSIATTPSKRPDPPWFEARRSVDMATEVHRTPREETSAKGPRALVT